MLPWWVIYLLVIIHAPLVGNIYIYLLVNIHAPLAGDNISYSLVGYTIVIYINRRMVNSNVVDVYFNVYFINKFVINLLNSVYCNVMLV